MTDKDVYEGLIDWLNKAWWGVPESPHLKPALEAYYTPSEAAVLAGLPFGGRYLEELAEMKDADPVVLKVELDALARKGAVWRSEKGGRLRYSLNDSFFVFMRSAFWPGRTDDRTRATAGPVNKYFSDGFMDQFAHAHHKGLRALPIDKTIADPRRILPYEDVAAWVDAQDYHTVSICPCRHRKAMDEDPDSCDAPMEACLHFGRLGRYIVENDMGREIAPDETHDILKICADAGLVHAVSNWQKGADTICNCCRDCCLFFEAYHELGHHRSHDPSNYKAKSTPATCKACGLCEERCPMDAVKLMASTEADNKKGLAARVDPDLCIGCGVCVHKCPTGTLTLERLETTLDPPLDARDWMTRFVADRKNPRVKKNVR